LSKGKWVVLPYLIVARRCRWWLYSNNNRSKIDWRFVGLFHVLSPTP
jgi:hypothetical protein